MSEKISAEHVRRFADATAYTMDYMAERKRLLHAYADALAAEREQEQAVDKYKSLCAAVYQAAGAYGLPERILDALSDAASGNIEQRRKTDDLLPCNPEPQAGVTDEAVQTAIMPEWADDDEKGRFDDCVKFLKSYGFGVAVAPMLRGVPDGWKLVPIEPTGAMLEAAETREDDEPLSEWGKIVHASHEDIYKAMLAASPKPGES